MIITMATGVRTWIFIAKVTASALGREMSNFHFVCTLPPPSPSPEISKIKITTVILFYLQCDTVADPCFEDH